ncbi:MAG: YitT family protein [Candidatus Muirbacterium halophilum]|nr:YitT family protein [Candidatus Muirbacterium halophilum]MCK9474375.1 YitT family protein [Candidatus Muirbacterium halophilum]
MHTYKKPLYQTLFDFILLNFGFIIYLVGYVYFLLPNKIVGGGLTGVCTILFYTLGIPVSVTLIVINAILMIIQYKVLGSSSSIKTLYVVLLQPVVIEIMLKYNHLFHVTEDRMLACLFGGVLTGLGMGVVIKVGGSTGGTDILAQVLSKYLKISIGRVLSVIDPAIAISAGVFLGNFEFSLYGIITIFFNSKIVDMVQSGLNYSRVVYVISDQYQIIGETVMGKLQRGVTQLEVKGMYSENDKKMLMIVIGKRQIFELKGIINMFDPMAFVVVTEAFSVMGRGFRQLKEDEE